MKHPPIGTSTVVASRERGPAGTDETERKARIRRQPPRASIWDRLPTWISVPGFVVFLLFLWWLIYEFELLSEFVLPAPASVGDELLSQLRSLVTGGAVWDSFWITAQQSVLGFLLAAVIGIGLGVIAAETAFGRRVMMPVVVAINAAPKVAFAPIFVAWLGFGIQPKIALAAFIAFFPLLIDTAAGLSAVDNDQLKLFRSLRASRWQTFKGLKLPNAAPYIFAGLKTASVLAVVGAVVGEFLGGGRGLGQDLRVAGNRLAIDRVWAYAIILSIGGYLFYWLVSVAERRIVFWRKPLHMVEL
jgi:NitT/TauT family transport system permease protein